MNGGERRRIAVYDMCCVKIQSEGKKGKRRGGEWRAECLPVDHRREELGDEALVVWAKLLDVAFVVALAVEIVWVEGAHGFERLVILFDHEVLVRVLAVPGVEAVVPDHRQTLLGERRLILQDVEEILDSEQQPIKNCLKT